MDIILILLVFLPATLASESDGSSHSLRLFLTYIKGKTQFPGLSFTTTLDDITVGYYNSKIYIPRGNTTNEDDVINTDLVNSVGSYIYGAFEKRAALSSPDSQISLDIYQILVMCELLDFNTSGKMCIKGGARGYTTDELCYFNDLFDFILSANISVMESTLERYKNDSKKHFYPMCIDALKKYIKKREKEINRKVEPQVKLFQKADSGGYIMSCLATGFYPRYISLTLLRDGQLVFDHEVTGGDLLPNGDGTYQMRKILEIRAKEREKHIYGCSVKHLDIELHFDFDDPPKDHIGLYIGVSVVFLVAVFVISAVFWKRHQISKKQARARQNGDL